MKSLWLFAYRAIFVSILGRVERFNRRFGMSNDK